MASLTLSHLKKIYDNGFEAVHDFDMEIKQGEFIVFVGPSGCGKSTTLRMIAGLELISKGELLINGVCANDLSPKQRGVAMVFQSYALYPHLTVYDNMAFGLTLVGYDEDVIDERVKYTAKILGLTPYLDRYPRELSGGQRQRVALGRAIIRKVEVFLMDEPLSNLDAKQRVTMRSEIIDIHRKVGATTIYVTHDQTEAMTMADRIVVMNLGYVQQIGTPYQLYFNPINQFVAGFIGEVPMNIVNGRIDRGRFVADGFDIMLSDKRFAQLAVDYEGRNINLGFRAESVYLGEKTSPNDASIDSIVELPELLGDNANVYLTVGKDKIIIKVSPYDLPEADSRLTFNVASESMYFFDPQTQSSLLYSPDFAQK